MDLVPPHIYVDGLSFILGLSPPILSYAEQHCNFPILLASTPDVFILVSVTPLLESSEMWD